MSNSKQEKIAEEIVQAGRFLHQLGLCPATTGNISMRFDDQSIAITASGIHKGDLGQKDILLVDFNGKPINHSASPSAETLLHTMIYQTKSDAGAVLHHHTLNGTVLSQLNPVQNVISTQGYEIHKIFPGINTHESEVRLPVFNNSQEMASLALEVNHYLVKHPNTVGFFLRGHGLYVWGKDMHEAKVRVEAFEFLFAAELKMRSLSNG